MYAFIGLLSLVGIVIVPIIILIKCKGQDNRATKAFIGSFICIALLISMVALDPGNDSPKQDGKKSAQTQKLTPEQKAKQEAQQKAQQAEKAQKDYNDWVQNQFSPWNGSNYDLVRLVKENMNDPSTFEHVETKYIDNGNQSLTIYMEFRGSNAFGGVVLNSVTGVTDYKTNTVKVTEYNGQAVGN